MAKEQITYLGVFATKEEIDVMKKAITMPYMVFRGQLPESPQEVSHRFALQHGLPEFPGYYGCDLSTGEFLKGGAE